MTAAHHAPPVVQHLAARVAELVTARGVRVHPVPVIIDPGTPRRGAIAEYQWLPDGGEEIHLDPAWVPLARRVALGRSRHTYDYEAVCAVLAHEFAHQRYGPDHKHVARVVARVTPSCVRVLWRHDETLSLAPPDPPRQP